MRVFKDTCLSCVVLILMVEATAKSKQSHEQMINDHEQIKIWQSGPQSNCRRAVQRGDSVRPVNNRALCLPSGVGVMTKKGISKTHENQTTVHVYPTCANVYMELNIVLEDPQKVGYFNGFERNVGISLVVNPCNWNTLKVSLCVCEHDTWGVVLHSYGKIKEKKCSNYTHTSYKFSELKAGLQSQQVAWYTGDQKHDCLKYSIEEHNIDETLVASQPSSSVSTAITTRTKATTIPVTTAPPVPSTTTQRVDLLHVDTVFGVNSKPETLYVFRSINLKFRVTE